MLSALLPIVTLPLFTQYMSPQDYGNWTIFTLIVMYVSTISRWEINNALKLNFFKSETDFSLYASTAFIFACGCFGLFGVFWLATLPWKLGWGEVDNKWFFVIGMLAFFRYQTVNLHQLLQIENRSLIYGTWSFLANLIMYGVALFMLMYFHMDWRARAWAELLVGTLSFAVAFIFWRKYYGLRRRFDRGVLVEMLISTSPLMLSSAVGYILITMDRLFIAKMVGAEQLGLYTIAAQLAASVGLFMSAVAPTWEATLYNYEGSLAEHIRKKLKVYAVIVLLTLIILVVMPTLLKGLLPYLTTKSFVSAEIYVFPTLMVATTTGLFALLQPIAVILKKGKIFAAINIGMLVTACAGMFLCIPIIGARGAAYSLAATYFAGGVLLFFFILRWVQIPLRGPMH